MTGMNPRTRDLTSKQVYNVMCTQLTKVVMWENAKINSNNSIKQFSLSIIILVIFIPPQTKYAGISLVVGCIFIHTISDGTNLMKYKSAEREYVGVSSFVHCHKALSKVNLVYMNSSMMMSLNICEVYILCVWDIIQTFVSITFID